MPKQEYEQFRDIDKTSIMQIYGARLASNISLAVFLAVFLKCQSNVMTAKTKGV